MTGTKDASSPVVGCSAPLYEKQPGAEVERKSIITREMPRASAETLLDGREANSNPDLYYNQAIQTRLGTLHSKYLEEHVPNSVRSCRRQRARNHAWHTLETDCVCKLLKVANDCREVDTEDRIDRTDTPLTSARVGAASVDRLRRRVQDMSLCAAVAGTPLDYFVISTTGSLQQIIH